MVKVLKASYFANTDFLLAQIGANPSYVWRSILESQEIIRKGACWRIGDGNTMSIGMDSWLHDPENPFVVTQFSDDNTCLW